jgi:hypothetical protein
MSAASVAATAACHVLMADEFEFVDIGIFLFVVALPML